MFFSAHKHQYNKAAVTCINIFSPQEDPRQFILANAFDQIPSYLTLALHPDFQSFCHDPWVKEFRRAALQQASIPFKSLRSGNA